MVEMIEVLANETNTLKNEIISLKRRVEELENICARLSSANSLYGPIEYGRYHPWLNN